MNLMNQNIYKNFYIFYIFLYKNFFKSEIAGALEPNLKWILCEYFCVSRPLGDIDNNRHV